VRSVGTIDAIDVRQYLPLSGTVDDVRIEISNGGGGDAAASGRAMVDVRSMLLLLLRTVM